MKLFPGTGNTVALSSWYAYAQAEEWSHVIDETMIPPMLIYMPCKFICRCYDHYIFSCLIHEEIPLLLVSGRWPSCLYDGGTIHVHVSYALCFQRLKSQTIESFYHGIFALNASRQYILIYMYMYTYVATCIFWASQDNLLRKLLQEWLMNVQVTMSFFCDKIKRYIELHTTFLIQ